MGQRVSCPRCDGPVAPGKPVCPRCDFAVMEARLAGRGPPALLTRLRQAPRPSAAAISVAAIAVVAAVAISLALVALPAAVAPPSKPLSATEAERRLALRYPRLRQAEHAVIACPDRRIEPGGEARCWILARVGLQRSVVVRLSRRGNAVRIDD
jgi:hypothetical protein